MNVFEMHFVALKKKYSLEVSSESTEISIKRERVICHMPSIGQSLRYITEQDRHTASSELKLWWNEQR